jgi:hypothetical protein
MIRNNPVVAARKDVWLSLALTGIWLLFCGSARAQQAPTPQVDFVRDVQPVLKAHCYQCHGGDQKQGGLRLDSRAFMLAGGASGAAIKPGAGAGSLLLARLRGVGGKPRMPLGFSPLTETQIAIIGRWIDRGAVWPEGAVKPHWAYMKPVRPTLPAVRNRAWVRNPIDAFVLARLEKEGLQPSPQADRITLLRRVTLDLTGLPPTPAEVDAFLADRSADAYERVVDRLLKSPHYGERMALPWLDAARYADSNGFQQDGDTYQYVWRDWVVRAMNANMPFDQFTVQQLAGDLLPNPTVEQKVATGFNRCHLLNGEGGAIPEEQRNVILFDRVDVTATTWLGATMACAQCHNHKYDPYTQRDYYSFMAFFNNVPETGTPPGGGQYRIADPWIYAGGPEEMARLNDYETRLADLRARYAGYVRDHAAEIGAAQAAWEAEAGKGGAPMLEFSPWQAAGPFPADSFDAAYDTIFGPERSAVGNGAPRGVAGHKLDLHETYLKGKLQWTPHPEWDDGKPHDLTGENSATYLYRIIRSDRPTPLTLSLGSDDAIKVWLNGVLVTANKVTRAVAPDEERPTVMLQPGENVLLMKIVNGGGPTGFYFKAAEAGIPGKILALLKTPAGQRSAADAQTVRDYFVANFPPAPMKALADSIPALEKQRDDYRMSLPKVMVMSDAQPRKTHLLERGNYEMPREEVTPATPAFLPAMPANAPKNRLGLAQWLVAPDNPLTARVQVNRYWQLFFGQGLVKTSENLGTQCDPPTHPELLDWLAVEFRESGWDVKHMHRLIVTSATYRQSSKLTPALRQRDPENRLLARGARFRLPSLLLRDVALASSGLLDPRIGGKPVYPYQPKGIWDGLAITNERDFTYPQSTGADLYRRSLYTFWRRTVAPANMFDASVRNTCKVRLAVTSTPLHALTTLNDITWVEAGRALAQHIMKEAGTDPDSRLMEAFRRVCARRPAPDELQILHRSLNRALSAYRADPAAATAYLKIGDSPRDETLAAAEHAAYATVCLAIYNLDESLTRE